MLYAICYHEINCLEYQTYLCATIHLCKLVERAPKSTYFPARITKSGAVWYQNPDCDAANSPHHSLSQSQAQIRGQQSIVIRRGQSPCLWWEHVPTIATIGRVVPSVTCLCWCPVAALVKVSVRTYFKGLQLKQYRIDFILTVLFCDSSDKLLGDILLRTRLIVRVFIMS